MVCDFRAQRYYWVLEGLKEVKSILKCNDI
jgi:hypothetical protein